MRTARRFNGFGFSLIHEGAVDATARMHEINACSDKPRRVSMLAKILLALAAIVVVFAVKPFAATNLADFTFKPENSQTGVTWSMTGNNNFIAKAINLFMNMDKMIGGQFEKGLAQMKSVVEAAPRP
jgi:hypothetical protein